ncbi:hypothetical protein [Micromonospora sp. A200]|uniref:hypothetical protein n=1 Tax=Micromonospora sp. A200 TaxID=2940568 RepID=UPI0024766CB9|nr:hypothetical protein [Micromonospora sp. A200]
MPDYETALTELDGNLVSGNYPFVAAPVDPFEVESLEFLEPDHSVYALRPAEPLEVVWGFYSLRFVIRLPGWRVDARLSGSGRLRRASGGLPNRSAACRSSGRQPRHLVVRG